MARAVARRARRRPGRTAAPRAADRRGADLRRSCSPARRAAASVFRAYRYGPDYAGLAGKDLKPGKTVEELQPKEPEQTKGAEKAKEAPKK